MPPESFAHNREGYTLIELTVVMALVGLVLTIAMPRLRDALLTDNLRTATRRTVGLINDLRSRAAEEQLPYRLHLDLETERLWVESPAMSREDRLQARDKARRLPPDVSLLDVSPRGREKTGSGETVLHFNSRGYVWPAVIHLGAADGRAFSLRLGAFFPKTRVSAGYSDFETD